MLFLVVIDKTFQIAYKRFHLLISFELAQKYIRVIPTSSSLFGMKTYVDYFSYSSHMLMESFGNIFKNFFHYFNDHHVITNKIFTFAVSLNKYVSSKIVFAFMIFVYVTAEQVTSNKTFSIN